MWTEITSERGIFVQTPFSRSTLILEFHAAKFHTAKPPAFSLHFLFRRDQNQTDFKDHENVWTDLSKKFSAPKQFKWIQPLPRRRQGRSN